MTDRRHQLVEHEQVGGVLFEDFLGLDEERAGTGARAAFASHRALRYLQAYFLRHDVLAAALGLEELHDAHAVAVAQRAQAEAEGRRRFALSVAGVNLDFALTH